MDSGDRTEIHRLREDMQRLESRLMDRMIQLAWRWVIAIWLSTLALGAVFLVAIGKHG